MQDTGNDNELPAEESELPPQEFLVSENPSESPSGLIGTEGLPPVDQGESAPAEGSGSELLSVDELLSEAVLEEGLLPEGLADNALLEAASAAVVPSFQLRLQGLTEEQKPALKKALEAQGIAVGEKTFATASPVVSQLTEFQAVQLLQALRAFGVQAQGMVVVPMQQSPTEDELALGDLSLVPEAGFEAAVESAPSVVLPKGEKDVLLCSPLQLPNSNVVETFGLVIVHRSIPRRLFREAEVREKLENELRTVPNRSIAPVASSHLQQVLRDLMLELRKSALAKGANSVLGVKIEAFPESSTTDPLLEQLRLIAFGTAAVVEKS
jgi:uncharacterized protein YbjQ (UPF0145 family)